MIDGSTGAQLWSEKFDSEFEDTLAVQSAITGRIASVLRAELLEADGNRAKPANMEAWDYAAKGFSVLNGRETQTKYADALSLFEESLELDPRLAQAWEGISFIHYVAATRRLPGVEGDHLKLTLDAARKAVQFDENSSGAQTALGLAYIWNGRAQLGLNACQTAVSLNRNDDDAHICEAQAWKALGEYRRSLESLSRAGELNPQFRAWRRNMLIGINWAHLQEYHKARDALLKAQADAPNHQVMLYYLASVQAHAGDLEEARNTLNSYLQYSGNRWNTIDKMREAHPDATPDFEYILDGLRKAGMAEK